MDLIFIYFAMLLIPAIASIQINLTFSRYKKEKNKSGKTGYDVAREILDDAGLNEIYIVETRGYLTDCYDASRKTIKLSSDVYHDSSIASISIAAHECGHAIQDKEGYSWMRIRTRIFPYVSIGTNIAYIILLIGIFLQAMDLIHLAIALTGLGLLFQLVTLPVELDASTRAKKILIEEKMVMEDEEEGISKMLGSAAMTYIAGILSSALEMLYLILKFRDRD